MNDFIFSICGKTDLEISAEALASLSLPDLMQLMHAEQLGKLRVIVKEATA